MSVLKKVFYVLFCFIILFSFSSCNNNAAKKNTDPVNNEQSGIKKEITSKTIESKTENIKYDTYTGLKPLNKVSFIATDPENTKGLSTKKIEFSYGISKNALPSSQTLANQKYFDNSGFDAIAYDNKVTEKILYLTFDCGYENGNTKIILDILKKENVKAAFFCTIDIMKYNPEIIAKMITDGHIVGNHSAKHPSFADIDRTKMASEIEICDNYLREKFGYTSPFFRFPQGIYTESAMQLVDSLGYKNVFWSVAYADWDVNAEKGAEYAFNTVTSRIFPGAIILLHPVSKDNAEAMSDIIQWAKIEGYAFKTLYDLP